MQKIKTQQERQLGRRCIVAIGNYDQQALTGVDKKTSSGRTILKLCKKCPETKK